jgi:hypothetical protein
MLSMSKTAAFALEYNLTPSSSNSSSIFSASSSSSAGSQFVLADSSGPVAIHDFGKFVTTFGSKQMPKKLLLHGSDFRWGLWLHYVAEIVCVCVRVCAVEPLLPCTSKEASEHTSAMSAAVVAFLSVAMCWQHGFCNRVVVLQAIRISIASLVSPGQSPGASTYDASYTSATLLCAGSMPLW